MAVLSYYLVERLIGWRSVGYHGGVRLPRWVKGVPRLGKTLVISTNDREVSDEESRSERFLKMILIYL